LGDETGIINPYTYYKPNHNIHGIDYVQLFRLNEFVSFLNLQRCIDRINR